MRLRLRPKQLLNRCSFVQLQHRPGLAWHPAAMADRKTERSYLNSAVDSINPWASSRPTTPASDARRDELPVVATAAPGDHVLTPFYGQSLRSYPKDCPPLNVLWFHAVDIIKGRQKASKDAKPNARPKKFTAFSASDSRRLEARYQKLLEAAEDGRGGGSKAASQSRLDSPDRKGRARQTSSADPGGKRVPVNEDYLFDVDIEERELEPVYWLGPVYEVRRGTWFFQEGSNLRPCEENLAAQLEEGYLKMKPWLYSASSRSHAAGTETPKSDSSVVSKKQTSAGTSTPKTMQEPGSDPSTPPHSTTQPAIAHTPQPYRLFGAYMSSVATYPDANTAWLCSDGVLSWVTTSVYERFAGGGYMSGAKLVRGYTEANKVKEKDDKNQDGVVKTDDGPEMDSSKDASDDDVVSRQATLQRQLSSLIENEVESEEQIRKREEQEIRDDYNAQDGESQGREIDHLVLVTHGIGQRLGLRMESVNFVHDVNVLRQTLKSVYANSADLKALNSNGDPGDCRVQVLPVCWRHLFEFPKQRQRKAEYDLGDLAGEDDRYPSLDDITVEGVAFARSLISDLALDVLLYQSSYRDEISKAVVGEANRIVGLFRQRNAEFKGKVHLMGHSLGSAIFFDVLCRQKDEPAGGQGHNPLSFWPRQGRHKPKQGDLQFDFDVHDYFCLGSPVGLFQMLKGRTIGARRPARNDAFLPTEADASSSNRGISSSVSSPKVGQLFNIFHPSDPISYRLEPLISTAMATLKPQALPYTKRGIFDSVAPQGLTGLGAKVGQSVSGLWSSLSAGIASNLLNRSLGLTAEEVTRIAAEESARHSSDGDSRTAASSAGAAPSSAAETDRRKQKLADAPATGEHGDVLIDGELETLYARFQNGRAVASGGSDADSARARRMRAEEMRVRALNRNGRVDYSIQESALDFNPINTIASHMGYWADEDVNHFILSQLLSSRPRPTTTTTTTTGDDDMDITSARHGTT
ncbi:hypothetical protein CDD80_4059 [Ophiocordyceps camponoti-rufipedis]|uniref:DDHD domain-containing protein n=1 Tax=Ophiocordyceps camponoti-rufipedis TaxID=2004952 RepID=A0A2C5ZJV7_9HYPO|nr:hypothetical protein CDD80_4059 [Ophiocordyceps camponoti-rufipedis]